MYWSVRRVWTVSLESDAMHKSSLPKLISLRVNAGTGQQLNKWSDDTCIGGRGAAGRFKFFPRSGAQKRIRGRLL